MNQDTFTLDEGQVVLLWPARLSPESYADLKDWLAIMGRKVARAVREPEKLTVETAEAASSQKERAARMDGHASGTASLAVERQA